MALVCPEPSPGPKGRHSTDWASRLECVVSVDHQNLGQNGFCSHRLRIPVEVVDTEERTAVGKKEASGREDVDMEVVGKVDLGKEGLD